MEDVARDALVVKVARRDQVQGDAPCVGLERLLARNQVREVPTAHALERLSDLIVHLAPHLRTQLRLLLRELLPRGSPHLP